MKKIIGLLILSLFCYTALYAQGDSIISIGMKIKIFSKILNEERIINISLPNSYKTTKWEYPVLLFTDGEDNYFIRTAGMVRHYNYYFMPEMIVVGIPNTNRERDLFPYVREQMPASGGGDLFLRFIAEELIPYIDSNFRTTSFRILAGESAGGLLAMYALFVKSDLFDAYIASAPAIGMGYGKLSAAAEQLLSKRKTFHKKLFIPYYEKDLTTITEYIPQLIKIFQKYSPAGFNWETKIYPGRNHVPRDGIVDGLLWIFSGWQIVSSPTVYPSNGLFAEGTSITITMQSEEDEIRYTLDGEEPTRESLLYEKPIEINTPTTLKSKSFRGDLYESSMVTSSFNYFKEDLLFETPANLKKGIRYRYFERNWYIIPDTLSIPPDREGITDIITTGLTEKSNGFIFQFDGYINIQQPGDYTFYLKNDGRCKLYINNKLIINAINPHSIEETSYLLPLKTGLTKIELLYTNYWLQGKELNLSYEGPGIKKQEIPAGVLLYNEK